VIAGDIWTALSAMSGAVAAGVALITVMTALKSDRDREKRALIERRSRAFQRIVAGPLDLAVDAYVETVTDVLEKATSALGRMKTHDAPSDAIGDYLAATAHDLDKCWHKLKARLTRGIEAWGDIDLRNAARLELERLQDAVNQGVEDLFTEASVPRFTEILNSRVADILKLAQRADPALADFYSPKSSGVWFRNARTAPEE
jgi:hypothetical protein